MLAGEFKDRVLPLSKKLLRFASQLLQNREEAEDVLQDILLKLWQKKDELGKVDNLEAYAMKMIRNRSLDVKDSKQRDLTTFGMWSNLPDETDHLENADSAKLVKRIISLLPELQRTVIYLRDLEQLEYNEIADITGLNENAVRVNLSRARKKVRDEILKIHNYGITENKHTAAKVL